VFRDIPSKGHVDPFHVKVERTADGLLGVIDLQNRHHRYLQTQLDLQTVVTGMKINK
jgi:hypothetical protein